MSSDEKKSEKPRLYVREWKLEPSEWRPATKEEQEYFEKAKTYMEAVSPAFEEFFEFFKRVRRFEKKLEEAFRELF